MPDGDPNIPKNGDRERSQEIPEEAMARLIEILTLMGEGGYPARRNATFLDAWIFCSALRLTTMAGIEEVKS